MKNLGLIGGVSADQIPYSPKFRQQPQFITGNTTLLNFNFKKIMLVAAAIACSAATSLTSAQVISTTPRDLTFPPTPIGTTSAPQTVTLSNVMPTRTPSGTIMSFGVGAPFVRTAGTCVDSNITLPCTVGIAYAPSAIGLQNSSATGSISGLGLFAIPLAGTGVQAGPAPSLNVYGVLILGMTLLIAAFFVFRR